MGSVPPGFKVNITERYTSYSMVTCAHLGVRWPDCSSLVTRSNRWNVIVRLLTLFSSHTLHQKRQQNMHNDSWETDQNESKCFDKMIFENRVKLCRCKHANVSLIFGIITIIHACFLKYFKFEFKLKKWDLSSHQSFDSISYSIENYHLEQQQQWSFPGIPISYIFIVSLWF